MNWLQKMATEKMMIIARGPSGSGKTHMVQELAESTGAEVFSTDDFFTQNGQYHFDPQKLGEAHEWNRQRVEDAVFKNVPVIIVDNTNSRFFEMRPYVELAKTGGYQVMFKEPDWNDQLKNEDGSWNVDFLMRMQDQPDRYRMNKSLDTDVVQGMVDKYEYGASVEDVLRAERPEII